MKWLLVSTCVAMSVLLGVCPSRLEAQPATAALTARIVDESGAAIPQAVVRVENIDTHYQRQAETTSAGQVTIPLLPSGTYTVFVEHAGFAPARVDNVALKDGGESTINVQLKVESLNDAVVVTAQKREERQLDVPVPMTVLNAEALASNSQLTLREYYATVPGFNVAPNIEGAQTLTLRGVTTGAFSNPTVGLLVDDVQYGSTTGFGGGNQVPDIDPGELARIEVLRGPQGTLYGSGSMGGLVKFVTKDPTPDRYSGRVEIGTSSVSNGAQAGLNLRASANVPLAEHAAMRISGFTRRDPGYIDNPFLNRRGVNESMTFGGRVSALWQFAPGVSLKVGALYEHSKADALTELTTPPSVKDLQQNYIAGIGPLKRTIQAYSGVFKARLGDVNLTSITGYNANQALGPFDFTPFDGPVTESQFGVPGTALYQQLHIRKFTQEVRLAAPIGRRFEWLAGGFVTHEGVDFYDNIEAQDPLTGRAAGQFSYSSNPNAFDEYAAFADLTYHITDRFDVQIGGRQSRVKTTYHDSIQVGLRNVLVQHVPYVVNTPAQVVTATPATYLVTPRFKVSPDLMVYARFASGFRPGAPNTFLTDVPPGSKPDTTRTYEGGLKGEFFNHALSIDGSLYYIDWQDIQIQLFSPALFAYSANGSAAKSEGAELSATVRPISGMTLAGWFAYDNAVLTEPFPADSRTYGVPGDRLPLSSRFSGSLSAEQGFPLWGRLLGFAGVSANFVGNRLGVFGATPVRQLYPAYTRTDLHAGVELDSWRVNVFVNNAGDSRGLINGGIGYLPSFAFVAIQPRTVGLSLTRTF